MKIYIGSDHGGFQLKKILIPFLKEQNIEVEDMGCFSEDRVDYPDMAKNVADKVVEDTGSSGILICGTGIGISIAANKVNGIRAALCHSEYEAEMTRKHNAANILCLGERVIGSELAKSVVKS